MIGVWTLRTGLILLAAALLMQGVSAGELLGGEASWLSAHGTGALFVHGSSLVAVVGAVISWRQARAPGWPVLVTVLIFLLTFAQAAVGGSDNLAIHVPGAIALTLLTSWLLVWSWVVIGQRRAVSTRMDRVNSA